MAGSVLLTKRMFSWEARPLRNVGRGDADNADGQQDGCAGHQDAPLDRAAGKSFQAEPVEAGNHPVGDDDLRQVDQQGAG